MTSRRRCGRACRLLFAAGLTLGLAACNDPPATTGEVPSATPAQLTRGRAVYNFRCYYCHGYSGDGKTLATTYLDPPPANFKSASARSLPPEKIMAAVRDGRPGTGMSPFRDVIPAADIAAVTAFVYDEFVLRKAPNTRYHTVENGWPNHERYRDAYPFAEGEIALTAPVETLSEQAARGRVLYMESCISCHDRGKPEPDPIFWDSRPLSFPRNNYDHKNPQVDAATSATPYRLHDIAPVLHRPTPVARRGEKLYQDNCAFCHAADGTGKNWIGAFLEPHPRNLTDPAFMTSIDRTQLRRTIQDGIANSSMPAWRSVLSDAEIDAVIAYIDAAFHKVRP